jgi:transcription initiation factor IIE alpha subunit
MLIKKNPRPSLTVECPACKAPCTIEEADDLEEGDWLLCDQCDEELTVVTVSPLVLEVDEEDVDDDFDYDDLVDDDDDGDDDDLEEDGEED